MPLVSGALLGKLLQRSQTGREAAFTWNDGTAGFPFVLHRNALPAVENLLTKKQFALQLLAAKTRAKKFEPGREFKSDLLNINTPSNWIQLKRIFREKH